MENGTLLQVIVEPMKMVSDGKLDALLLGSTGAYCQNCRLSREEAHSIERITEVCFCFLIIDQIRLNL